MANISLIIFYPCLSQFINVFYIRLIHCICVFISKINWSRYLSYLCQCICIYKIFGQHLFFVSIFQNNTIFYWNYIGISHIMLLNLKHILFLFGFIIESFKKIFIRRFSINNIIIYRNTIILNTLNKVAYCIELKVVKIWSTYFNLISKYCSNVIFVFFNLYNICAIYRSISLLCKTY